MTCALSLCAALALTIDVPFAYAQSKSPVIVFVHGRNQQGRTNDELRKEWLSSFDQGLSSIGAGGLIPRDALRFVYYQDLYVDGATVVCPHDEDRRRATLAPLRAALERAQQNYTNADNYARQRRAEVQAIAERMGRFDPLQGQTQEFANLLAQLGNAQGAAQAASARVTQADAELASAADALKNAALTFDATLRGKIADFERAVPDISWEAVKSRVFDVTARALSKSRVLQRAAIDWVFTDTKKYIQNYVYRCATDARLASVLTSAAEEGRRVILVAHSMGSLVAFHVMKELSVRDNPPLVQLISIGSQLGVREFMPALISGFEPPLPVPIGINWWRNLRGQLDYVAPRPIGSLYDTRRMVGFSEWLIATPDADPHAVTSYMTNPASARSIASRWCGSVAPKPAGCAAVRDVQAGDGGARALKR